MSEPGVQNRYLSDAYNSLGNLYLSGHMGENEIERCISYYEQGAELGNVSAMGNLGRCYKRGWGVEVNMEKAKEWDRKAMENGIIDEWNRDDELMQDLQELGLIEQRYCYLWLQLKINTKEKEI